MKLLIICQALDKKHPILGFFHRWVEEFAKHVEHIHVIALQVGEHDLPKNVSVHSLGKEKRVSRITYLKRFYTYIWKERSNYDSVFVHMNPEYIILAALWWRFVGKKVSLWYNHTVGSMWLNIAQLFTHAVFHTSPFAYTARYKNAKRMPAGIDTDVFKPQPHVLKIPKSLYFQGRITASKNIHLLFEAFAKLHKAGKADLFTLVGPEDEPYTKPLRATYKNLIDSGVIVFKGPVPNNKTPELFAAYTVSVNLTAAGNYDKTVLESFACGTPCVVASDAFSGVVPERYIIRTKTLEDTLANSLEGGDTLDTQKAIQEKESLTILAKILPTFV